MSKEKEIIPTKEVEGKKEIQNPLFRKRYTASELKAIAQKKYFTELSAYTEIYASEYGQFFLTERALIEATKDYPNILKIKISR